MNSLSLFPLKCTELGALSAGKEENEASAMDTELSNCVKD